MILTYSKEQFKYKIIALIKIHSIRKDKPNRWKPGMLIHHWLFSPRHPSKHPHEFGRDVCFSTQFIQIFWEQKDSNSKKEPFVYIDESCLSDQEVEQLAINDGFESSKSFFAWFNEPFNGKIIHWTAFQY